MKTSELTGVALDWAVARCNVDTVERHNTGRMYLVDRPWADKSRIKWIAEYSPSKHWAQGGPIIEREGVSLTQFSDYPQWTAKHPHSICYDGTTPLIAAMRCYVASRLGEEVDIPDELKEK